MIGGAGNDRLTFLGGVQSGGFVLGTSSGGNTTFSTQEGADTILVSYSFIVGRLQLDGGSENDTLDVRTSAASGDVTVVGGTGADSLKVDTNYFVAGLLMSGGDDGDRLELKNSLGIKAATIDGGAGNDAAFVANLTAKRMTINLGTQNDVADVRGSLFDEFFANLGDQDDSLAMYGNLIRQITIVDGGPGGDAFFDVGNTHRGGIRRIGIRARQLMEGSPFDADQTCRVCHRDRDHRKSRTPAETLVLAGVSIL